MRCEPSASCARSAEMDLICRQVLRLRIRLDAAGVPSGDRPEAIFGPSVLSVLIFVTVSAQGDEVQIVVIALLAPRLLVVNMQILPGTTELSSQAITPPYLLPQLAIRFRIKPQARPLGSNSLHEAFSATSCRKACRCSVGRNLKNRDMD